MSKYTTIKLSQEVHTSYFSQYPLKREKSLDHHLCVMSYPQNECHFMSIYTKIMTFNYFRSKYQGRLGQFTKKLHFYQNKFNLHLNRPPKVTSCLPKMTLGLKCGMLGKGDETLGLQRPKICPHVPIPS
jgi:hypothetical protein